MVSLFDRAGSLARGLRRKPGSKKARRDQDRRLRLAIDQLESRLALTIASPLSIGGTTVGSYFDAPTGVSNLGDFVTVSIEGTKGTVVFNGGAGILDGNDIQTIEIIDASPDFQMTFTASVTLANPVPYSSDGVIQMGKITTSNVIRGINTVRGPLTLTAAPQEIETSAIHLYTFNDGTVSGNTVSDLVGGADGTLFNGATVSNGQLVLADNSGATGANVQYMQMPDGVLPDGTTAATFELWFTASNTMSAFGRGFDFGSGDSNYLLFTPFDGSSSQVAIAQTGYTGEKELFGASLKDGNQHLATVTVDDASDTMIFYVDGTSVGSIALDSINLSGLEALYNFLGRSQYSSDPGFIGSMDQFAIYDRVLTPSEVAANYTAGPIAGSLAPIGFTQTTPGSATMELEGDQTTVFPVGTLVTATPLLSNTTIGSPTFSTVEAIAFDANTNRTTITLAGPTAAGTTAGALTLAEAIRPEFRLTQFVGVNFSNLNLKDGGGLFVDVVEGADADVFGSVFPNVGILLTDGLLAYSTIGIRKELAATVLLGTKNSASVDGRMFVEFATPESLVYVGPQNRTTSKNSKFQLTGGPAPFGAGVVVNQPFDGVVNLGGPATGSWVFARGVGPNAVLNADSWVGQTAVVPFVGQRGVLVNGNFAGSINATSGDATNDGDIALFVSGNLAATARVNGADDISFSVGGSVLKGATIAAGNDVSLLVARNFAGALANGGDLSGLIGGDVTGATIAASSDISLAVGGSIVNSSLSADSAQTLDVAGSIRNSRFFTASDDMSIDVAGSVTNSSFNVGYEYDLELVVGGSLSGSNLQAGSDISVGVAGNVTSSLFTSTSSDVTIDVGGDFLKNKVVTGDEVELTVGRDALSNTVIGDDDLTLDIGRNWRGVAQSASSDIRLNVGGSVLKGSSFSSGEDTLIDVAGNFDAGTTSRDLRFFVGGNVSQASRIVAQRVTDWQDTGEANFGIGGRFDGIVNVVEFDAAPNYQNVTLIGGGAGKAARFYVDRFATDNLSFNGNFQGNLRVLQDLVANLNFGGNVDRITIGGTVGSYEVTLDNGNSVSTVVPVSINVAGRLLYLNSNSLFQAAVAGVSGTFYNDTTSLTSFPSLPATGILTTGRYVKVVPNRQTVPVPTPPGPQTYTAPTAPQNFSASPTTGPDGINVSFEAPSSDGGLPVVYYEYTTNGGTNWRRFNTPSQGPGTNIALTVDSLGSPFVAGPPGYSVGVRAVNAIGGTPTTFSPIEIPTP
ncbi:MAG: LamG-like jellyroll fold domain-containing protein [Planctomycetaceae bacterium]